MWCRIHWKKHVETREWKIDLQSSRSGFVDFIANKMDLWSLFIAKINSPKNIPGHATFTPFCETWRTLSLNIFWNCFNLKLWDITMQIWILATYSTPWLQVDKRNQEQKQISQVWTESQNNKPGCYLQSLKIETESL